MIAVAAVALVASVLSTALAIKANRDQFRRYQIDRELWLNEREQLNFWLGESLQEIQNLKDEIAPLPPELLNPPESLEELRQRLREAVIAKQS